MARYFLHISYIGTRFHGWQKQENAQTIQQSIEEALSTILRSERIPITGCGRTDTGVHASEYFAHFDTDQDLEADDYVFKLNSILHDDIAVHRLFGVDDQAHTRFDALARQYTYRFHLKKDPFSQHFSAKLSHELDIDAMNEACHVLLQTKDFTSFAKINSDTKTNLCDVTRAEWSRQEDSIIFTIEANRFLRNMVRAVVGTMIEIGKGKMDLQQFKDVIAAKDRSRAGTSAPAVGLSLSRVEYPYLQRQ
jgi:tRNA pseudouridine38-40 synthase